MSERSGWSVWELDVFKRAYATSLDVHRSSQDFPRNEQFGGVADQLRRSSKSICALIAEGLGRQRSSDAEFRRYLIMALASADETKLWCAYARDLGFASKETCDGWTSSYEEIARMLQGLIKRISSSDN